MVSSITCYAPRCSQPVSGQCSGYKGNCGQFYCRTHSKEKLCGKCAGRKAADNVEEERTVQRIIDSTQREKVEKLFGDYLRAAEDVDEKWQASRPGVGLFWGIVLFFVGVVVGGIVPVFVPRFRYASNEEMMPVMGLTGALVVALYAVWEVYRLIRDMKRSDKQHIERISRLSARRPGFAEFYAEYEKYRKAENEAILAARRRALLRVLGSFAVGATTGTIVQVARDAHRDS